MEYRLEEWPIWKRLVTALAILVAVFLALWVIYHMLGDDQAVAQNAPSKWDAQMQVLDRQALDKAYAEQMSKIWLIWLQDGGGGTTERQTKGFRNARRAYVIAMTEIEQRDAEIEKRVR